MVALVHLLFQIQIPQTSAVAAAVKNTWSWMPWAAGGAAVLCLCVAYLLGRLVLKRDPGDERMVEVSEKIRSGAFTFIKREYVFVTAFAVVMIILLSVALRNQDGWMIALCFLLGAAFSLLAGVAAMHVATRANTRTAQAARSGLRGAFDTAMRSGGVTGLAVVGLALLGIAICYLVFETAFGLWNSASIIVGFALGASSVALFARVGGGIFWKAADVGADTAGHLEDGVREDDPRNAAVIADNVGDNVGNVAGMGADLFESFVAATIAPIVIAAMGGVFRAVGTKGMVLPLAIAGVGVVASLIGIVLAHYFSQPGLQKWFRHEEHASGRSLSFSTYTTGILAAAGSVLLVRFVLGSKYIGLIWAPLLGIAAGALISLSTEYFTSARFRPVRGVAASGEDSHASMMLLRGTALGMGSTIVPIAAIAIAIGVAYYTGNHTIAQGGGLYGIALAALGMLTITGMVVAAEAFGPVADNAGGIARIAGMEEKVRDVTDSMDEAGNTTAAIARGFAIGSAALGALALIAAYVQSTSMSALNLAGDWKFLVGILIGAAVPFVFAAIIIGAVARGAAEVAEEAGRQFAGDEKPEEEGGEGEKPETGVGEVKGTAETEIDKPAKPDYQVCVDIASRAALYEMLLPGAVAIIIPLLIGAFMGKQSLAGFLIGALAVGFILAVFMSNSGGAWNNAKRYIERGLHGGTGSMAHDASIISDTFGDSLKDAAGPAMNVLIKVMAIVSLLFVPLFLK